jgi:hypothetical protein
VVSTRTWYEARCLIPSPRERDRVLAFLGRAGPLLRHPRESGTHRAERWGSCAAEVFVMPVAFTRTRYKTYCPADRPVFHLGRRVCLAASQVVS